jgi:hypothetical protein
VARAEVAAKVQDAGLATRRLVQTLPFAQLRARRSGRQGLRLSRARPGSGPLVLLIEPAHAAPLRSRVKGAAGAAAAGTAGLPLKQPRREASVGAGRASAMSPLRPRDFRSCFSEAPGQSRSPEAGDSRPATCPSFVKREVS